MPASFLFAARHGVLIRSQVGDGWKTTPPSFHGRECTFYEICWVMRESPNTHFAEVGGTLSLPPSSLEGAARRGRAGFLHPANRI